MSSQTSAGREKPDKYSPPASVHPDTAGTGLEKSWIGCIYSIYSCVQGPAPLCHQRARTPFLDQNTIPTSQYSRWRHPCTAILTGIWSCESFSMSGPRTEWSQQPQNSKTPKTPPPKGLLWPLPGSTMTPGRFWMRNTNRSWVSKGNPNSDSQFHKNVVFWSLETQVSSANNQNKQELLRVKQNEKRWRSQTKSSKSPGQTQLLQPQTLPKVLLPLVEKKWTLCNAVKRRNIQNAEKADLLFS